MFVRPKYVLAVLCAGLLALLTTAPEVQAQSDDVADSVTAPDATVYVDGLACPFCAYGLEKKLNTLGAIRRMEVQLEEGRVLLVFKEDQSLTKEQIRQAVKKAGFSARKIEFPGGTASEGASS